MRPDLSTTSPETGRTVQPAPRFETTARVQEWAFLTGRDFERMDKANTVVLVSVSPLEVHGPHLPVITDNLESEALIYRAAELLQEEHPEMEFVHLPSMYVAADVLPHPGSIKFRQKTIIRVLEDLGRSLAAQGFVHIWVASFHGGPRHFVPIEVAAARTNKRFGTKMISVFSLLINRISGGRTDLPDLFGQIDGLTPDELQGDAHAGAVETSLMLHLLGDHVDDTYAGLEQNTLDIKLAREGRPPMPEGRPTLKQLMRGFKEKLKYYESETYSGKPSIASPGIGADLLDLLAGKAAAALGEVWRGELDVSECHSPVWPVRWVFTNETLSWAFETALKYKNRIW